ncbi:MAG TPA: tripartite tricarboxylate transporter substrate binding protein [Burkholderiales bacterium]|nr:tripartite tricarboxylate transporter substrate binding protein [Burkholderiales bacterium]
MSSVFIRIFSLALLLATFNVAGQDWPARPVRILVPLGAGGFADVPARMLAPAIGKELGGTFFVENKPGAGSTIGANEIAKSAPDGYNLLFSATPHVISAHVYKKRLQYDALKDFTPIARVAAGPYVLAVHPSLGAKSVKELIALAKKEPGKIDFASSGNGSAQHLVGAMFATMAGIELSHVPYKGSGQAMQDVLAGRVKVTFAGVPNVINQVRDGRLRALGVTGAQRWPDLPDVPTIAEAGVPGYEALLWLALFGPAGLPDAIVNRLAGALEKALADPDTVHKLRTAGIAPAFMGPKEFGPFVNAEYDKWGKVVKETGATVN